MRISCRILSGPNVKLRWFHNPLLLLRTPELQAPVNLSHSRTCLKSRVYGASPGRRRRRTLLCFERDRHHQSEQQILRYQSESLMKGSSYCVFLCVAEFIHDKFPRVKTECNRAHEGLQRKRRLPARARIVRRCQEQAERSSAQPLRFTYL